MNQFKIKLQIHIYESFSLYEKGLLFVLSQINKTLFLTVVFVQSPTAQKLKHAVRMSLCGVPVKKETK